MKSTGIISVVAMSRTAVIVASYFYAYAIHFAHGTYLNPVWEYYGFTYREPGVADVVLMACLVTITALLLPSMVTRPSSIIVLLLFVVVFVPTAVITLSLDTDRIELYGPSLVLLCAGFVVACIGARHRLRRTSTAPGVPGDTFSTLILGLWIVCALVLIYEYQSVMGLVTSVEQLYVQRAAGASTNLIVGYVQTYFSNVLSPALIALGLMRSRYSFVVIGTIGCAIMFIISAQRTVILLPIAMFALYFALTRKAPVFRTSSFLMLSLGGAVMLCAAFHEESAAATFFSLFLVFRTLGLPGLTFSQYHELFSNEGFTWWSHVKGLGLLIPTPESYVNDPAWPSLGYMIGDRLYDDIENNANANLFSGDGVAAAGALGVVVIAVILAFWLAWLDRTSRGWNRTFAILVILPIALSLTNGHFFTMLLSFGGLFWMLTFHLYKPGR